MTDLKFDEAGIEKMRRCSLLLPDPGGEVVRQCLDEIKRLRSALLVAAMETDVLGDVDVPLLAYEIAVVAGRNAENITDADYIEAYIRATERLG